MLKLYIIAFYFCKACGSYETLKWTLEILVRTKFFSFQWCSGGKKQWERVGFVLQTTTVGFLGMYERIFKSCKTYQKVTGLGCFLGCCLRLLLLLLLSVTARKPKRALSLHGALSSVWNSQGIIWGISWCLRDWLFQESEHYTGQGVSGWPATDLWQLQDDPKGASSTHGVAILTAGKLCFVLGFIQTPAFFHSIR